MAGKQSRMGVLLTARKPPGSSRCGTVCRVLDRRKFLSDGVGGKHSFFLNDFPGWLLTCSVKSYEIASRALSAITSLKPDLVIADISLKDSSGLELMRNIKAQFPQMTILVVSVHDESIYAEIAFRAGALGYLMKQEALDKILIAIRRVLEGNIYVSDALASKMLQQQIRGQTDISESPVKSLSDRELEVFQLIGQWKKTKEIAQELHLSIKTVEYYREQIKRKLNLRDASELTQHATSWVQRGAAV